MDNQDAAIPQAGPSAQGTVDLPNHHDMPADRENEQPAPAQKMTEAEMIALAKVRADNAKAVQDSREAIWYLKEIMYNGDRKKIVTQNYNGPCSFIAICNILILRNDITILPPERTSVSYDILAQLLGDYLLQASPDVDISAALTMMPLTQKGMDLNPLFTSHDAFRPADDAGALKLFEQANIQLVHGWLADPSSPEYDVVSRCEDYDTSVNLIVEADTLTKGQLVTDENVAGPSASGSSNAHSSDNLSERDKKKIEDALIVRNFLDTTSSQLTYHGLFTLASSLQHGNLVALFRNSHLSVLHRRADENETGLYNLVTDYVFHNEPSVIWERLEDVDGSGTTFVDADFRKSSPAGGDFAGHTAQSALDVFDPAAYAEFDPADQELARQLQHEEDAHAQEAYARRQQQVAERERQGQRGQQQYQNASRNQYAQPQFDPRNSGYPQGPPEGQAGARPRKMKKEKSCIIM